MSNYYNVAGTHSRSTHAVMLSTRHCNDYVVFVFLFVFLQDHCIYVSHIVVVILYLFLQGFQYYTPLLVVVFELHLKILFPSLFFFIYVTKGPVS